MISNLKEIVEERVTEIQLLLDDPNKKSLVDFANLISPNNQFVKDQEALGEKIIKDELKANFNVAFKKSEIFAECKKYNLAFISAQNYEGEYSTEFLSKLKSFFEEKKMAVSINDYQSLLYVLAPAESDTEDTIVMRYPCKNPMVFWKMPNNYYVLIDGSRDYLTPVNLWRGIKNLNELGARVGYFMEHFVVLYVLFYSLSWHFNWNASYWWTLGVIFLAAIGQFIRMSFRNSHKSGTEHHSSCFNDVKYNS